MDTMKKPWVYKRKNIKGRWVGWYEGGKRKSKALPSKALAEHFRHIKYTQLNSDVFTSVVDFDWRQLINEYHHTKEVEGLQDASIYEVMLTLKHFKTADKGQFIKADCPTKHGYIRLGTRQGSGKNTLNKDIRNISAFLNWAVKNRYITSGLKVKKVKVPQKPVIALFPQQVHDLIKLVSEYPTLRLRVLLAVTTGLRRGDIEDIRIGDIHFDRNTITTRKRKANKAMAERPIPEQITTELSNYVATLPDGQELLFADRFSPKKWAKIRRKTGLPDLKFHDLRKTFASLLAQRGVSTAVTQRLLKHSTPQLTNQVYTNVDPVLRQAINLLPAEEWL